MITIFNRKELMITFDMKKLVITRDLLKQNHIPYSIKVIDRERSSLFWMGTRTRIGTLGQNLSLEREYIIYVKKVDYEKAFFIINKNRNE